MGVVIGSAVVPIACAITWAKCSGFAAIAGAMGGLIAAVLAWVFTAQGLFGKVTIDTLGNDYPMLAGGWRALCGCGWGRGAARAGERPGARPRARLVCTVH